jgi:hypothetical protein
MRKSVLRPRLNSYHPLCFTDFGRAVIQQHGLPPFIDASIRREPDFENEFPSITGLCRLDKFAPHLCVGTKVAYITAKGRYFNDCRHWRLVAILEVVEQFLSANAHEMAFTWYRERGVSIPKNCMAFGNRGAAFELSSQRMDMPKNRRTGEKEWDAEYAQRCFRVPAFNITKAHRLDLIDPPELREDDMVRIFGRVPGTQNPPIITDKQLCLLFHEFDKHKRDGPTLKQIWPKSHSGRPPK